MLWSHITLWTLFGFFILLLCTMISYDTFITLFNRTTTKPIAINDFKYWEIKDRILSIDEASYMIANYWANTSTKQQFYKQSIIKKIELIEVNQLTTVIKEKANSHAWLFTFSNNIIFTIHKTADNQEIHRVTLSRNNRNGSLLIICITSEMIGYEIKFESFVNRNPIIHFLL
jgi:hypothetical protein